MAKVSVVIPAYNSSRFIAEAVASVLTQTFADTEVIVVDDGSTDATGDIVARFPGVTCIRKPNGGASSARNFGVRMASGELIAFLDADDVWHPQKLAAQVRLMDLHPDCDLGYTLRAEVAEGMDPGRALLEADGTVSHARFEGLEAGFLNPFLCTSTVIVRRSAFDRVGGFDESLPIAEDVDFYLRVLVGRPAMLRLEAVSVYKRLVRGSLGDDSVAGAERVLQVYRDLFREHPQIERENPRLVRRCHALLHQRHAASLLHRGDRWHALREALRSVLFMPSMPAARVACLACMPVSARRAVKKVMHLVHGV